MFTLNAYLEDIEKRLNPEQEERILREWQDYAQGLNQGSVFRPVREKSPSTIEWPDLNINDCLEDEELMFIDQLSMVSNQLEEGFGGLLKIRANYGVGIVPSLFGCEPFIMPYEMNTLPNVKHIPGGISAMKKLIKGGVPSFDTGWGKHVFSCSRKMKETIKEYPNIQRSLRIDHPDCQSPMDICELLWGSDIFMALIDEADTVHALLELTSRTYEEFLDLWFAQFPPHPDGLHSFFGMGHLGKVCLRDDSAMNISPDMYKEFILPYNNRILNHFDGGAIHSCGRVDHFSTYLRDYDNLYGFNLSQPEYNNMEIIFSDTIEKGLPLLGLEEIPGINEVDSARHISVI